MYVAFLSDNSKPCTSIVLTNWITQAGNRKIVSTEVRDNEIHHSFCLHVSFGRESKYRYLRNSLAEPDSGSARLSQEWYPRSEPDEQQTIVIFGDEM